MKRKGGEGNRREGRKSKKNEERKKKGLEKDAATVAFGNQRSGREGQRDTGRLEY